VLAAAAAATFHVCVAVRGPSLLLGAATATATDFVCCFQILYMGILSMKDR